MSYEWATALGKAVTRLGQRIAEHLPQVLGAAALVLVGWVVARLLMLATARLMARLGWLVRSPAIQQGMRRIGVDRTMPDVIAGLVFWVVFFLFLTAAAETLGLPVLATWLGGVSHYLPRLLAAILILLAGVLLGGLARDAITTAATAAGVVYGDLLGRVVQIGVLLVAVVTGVDQVGIDSKFLTITIATVIGATAGGLAIAFGLGSRTAVSNIIAAHYLRQSYRIGHTVKVGGIQGRILEITTTAVVLDSPDGRALVPAKEFGEAVSILVTAEGPGGH